MRYYGSQDLYACFDVHFNAQRLPVVVTCMCNFTQKSELVSFVRIWYNSNCPLQATGDWHAKTLRKERDVSSEAGSEYPNRWNNVSSISAVQLTCTTLYLLTCTTLYLLTCTTLSADLYNSLSSDLYNSICWPVQLYLLTCTTLYLLTCTTLSNTCTTLYLLTCTTLYLLTCTTLIYTCTTLYLLTCTTLYLILGEGSNWDL